MQTPVVVSLVPSYNPNNDFVSTVVDELNRFSKVVLFTTEQHTLNVSETVYFDKSVGRDLTYKPREWVVDNLDQEWDYVLYNEDDILIPKQSLERVIELYESLPSPLIPGFVRYEYDDRDNTKRYFDLNPLHGVHRGQEGTVKHKFDELEVWEPWNVHSGNWLFSKRDVQNMISHNLWEVRYKQYGYQYGNCDQLESAASVPYLFYTKVYPFDVEAVECLHLPKKYIYFAVNPTKADIL